MGATHRLLAAVAGLAALAGPAVVAATPATAQAAAAGCEGRGGIVVVVDYAELGGGVVKGCDPDGGSAANNFTQAGFDLTRASRDPSFVCRVAGKPASDPCVNAAPADAFWSLWWSDGSSGSWVFSTDGVSSLNVSEGGYVAFAWHQGAEKASAPGVIPSPRQALATPEPSPTTITKPTATAKPTKKPKPSASAKPTATTGTTTVTATPTESTTESTSEAPSEIAVTPTETAVETPSSTATTGLPSIDEITDGPETTSSDASTQDDDGGFPAWLGIGLVVVVLGAAGVVPILRRRRG